MCIVGAMVGGGVRISYQSMGSEVVNVSCVNLV